MRQIIGLGLAAACVAVVGCKSEPLEDDEAANILMACCNEARGRIETVKDVATDDFRTRCGGCRKGKSKGGCETAATKIQATVKNAYPNEPWPVSCTTMRDSLGEMGISIPEIR